MDERDDDDGPFDLDDLLWLIGDERDETALSLLDLCLNCERREIDVTEERLAGLVAEAQAAGLVEIWEAGQAYVTLTPLAAERLGLELRIDSRGWIPRGKAYQEQVGLKEGEDAADVDPTHYADPTLPEPIDAIVIEEERRGTLLGPGEYRLSDRSTYKLNQVLGVGKPWPWALLAGPGEPCRGCGGIGLPRNAVCAVCHASGVDGLLPPIEPGLRRPARPPADDLYVNRPKPAPPAAPKLSGGLGAKVKGRKRMKMSAA